MRSIHIIISVCAMVIITVGSVNCRAETSAEIVGTWQIVGYSREFVDTKEVGRPFGEHPIGYIQYSPSGHLVVFLSSGEPPKPTAPMYSDPERIAIYNQIIGAYAGTYQVEGNKVVHHILAAWRPEWIGGDQIRFYTIVGKTLTIRTAPITSALLGRDVIATLTFERVE